MLLSHGVVVARRYQSANLDLQTVVEESLGKLKGVVGVHRAAGIGGVVDAYAYVEGLQGRTGDIIDLALQEGTEGGVHRESVGVAVGQIHACGEHGDGNLATFFIRHGVQLTADTVILRSFDNKLQSHVVESFGDNHATVESNITAHTTLIGHAGLGALCGGDVQLGIHGIACEFHKTAILDGEGLQRDDGQRIFHLTIRECIASCQVDALGVVLHA